MTIDNYKVEAMQKDLSNIVEKILEKDSHEYTCHLGKIWITLVVHDYHAKVSGFSEEILKLELTVVDATTTVMADNDDKIIIQIYQALPKPYEDVSLISTFQVKCNVTKINTTPMQFNPRSQFVIVLPN